MKKITLGITAHVDSGKTTLAESMLFLSGAITTLGRVDSGNSFLDTNSIERDRGITIFSSQARLESGDTQLTLLDTPGHVDFSAETERTFRVLDYAVLVISGTDGVQSHTATLWKMLRKYGVPVFIFVNKMDLTGADHFAVLEKLRNQLSQCCCDFSLPAEELPEAVASCDEYLMEEFLESGSLSDQTISEAVRQRRIFPCFFGSALKQFGVKEFLAALDRFTIEPERQPEFGAKVYKISYDSKGSRLTHLKIMGGELKVRDEITYTDAEGNSLTEKISSLRMYAGEKFTIPKKGEPGDVCTVTGLTATAAGMGLGCVRGSDRAMLEPVMTYQVLLPPEKNMFEALKDMRRLEDEDPQLHVVWNEQLREIHLQLMGAVQLEVLSRLAQERFGYSISFGSGAVSYRETILAPVEGVGHYEPLRHYAEVHLILEPLPRGSGLRFDTVCHEDELDRNWQRLILTHLQEKTHLGVLTGSPITDMKLTLASGKAHLKHTEGGDFRQATYRAVRQGLMQAQSVLLEPYYDYELEVPAQFVGRAIADLQHLGADFDPPETTGDSAVIRGSAPVSKIGEYQSEVISYTRGHGRLSCIVSGYRECQNAGEVIEAIGYDPEHDTENSPDSVFCKHGAGYLVKWDEVPQHMHLPSALTAEREEESSPKSAKTPASSSSRSATDEELMAIFERTYGKQERDPRKAFKKVRREPAPDHKPRLPEYTGPSYLLVDGYNVIFAWDELKSIAKDNLEAARNELIRIMADYQGSCGYEVIIVFDAYNVRGRKSNVEKLFNVSIVYTGEAETADTYIERVTHDLAKNHRVRVATSDGPEQLIILGNGAMRMSAAELHQRVMNAKADYSDYLKRE